MEKNFKNGSFRHRLHTLVYEADTPAGKRFDIILLVLILMSVLFVMLESVPSINSRFAGFFKSAEWFLTIFFTFEYIARIVSIKKPSKYIFSFYGIIDLLAILPTYLELMLPTDFIHQLMVIRALRLLRVFRILKLFKFLREAKLLGIALRRSRPKIIVFLFAVLTIAMLMGTVMYLIESADAGFTSIPRSIYWAIVTLTTVGYGDIAPQTPLGQFFAAIIMILGYAIIAVPTGIVGAEISKTNDLDVAVSTQACLNCSKEGHDEDAAHCKFCGESLRADGE